MVKKSMVYIRPSSLKFIHSGYDLKFAHIGLGVSRRSANFGYQPELQFKAMVQESYNPWQYLIIAPDNVVSYPPPL